MTQIKKTKLKQISLKISTTQLKELRNHAKQTGENPISFHIRQAIHEYLQKKQ
ncbi:MAG: ribbon-helix-helix protein, CopG family [Methanobacterium sp.]|nr:ribbon-helix-helix protein, CopG family [Methanobacterium sp.]